MTTPRTSAQLRQLLDGLTPDQVDQAIDAVERDEPCAMPSVWAYAGATVALLLAVQLLIGLGWLLLVAVL